MFGKKLIGLLTTFALIVSLLPISAQATEVDVEGPDALKELVQVIRNEYPQYEMNPFELLDQLKSVSTSIPDQYVMLDFIDNEEYTMEVQEYVKVNVTDEDTVPAVESTVPEAENTAPEADGSQTEGDPDETDLIAAGQFHFYYDQYLELFKQSSLSNYRMPYRFEGTQMSRIELDIYRLLHEYRQSYLQDLSDDQEAKINGVMGLLLADQLKQAEAILHDMNTYMSFLQQHSEGKKGTPPSEAQQKVANQHWDLAMSKLEQGIVVAPAVLLHNSIRESNRVLKLYDLTYKPEDITKDSDNDQLIDLNELSIGSDPFDSDTDQDGLSDYFEYVQEFDPVDPDSNHDGITDPMEDHDLDRLSDLVEQSQGTDPFLDDTDSDQLSDYDEIYIYQTNPLKYDTDEDGVSDAKELEIGTDPLMADTDGDGILDGQTMIDEGVTIREDLMTQFAEAGAIPQVMVHGVPNAGNLTILNDAIYYDQSIANIVGLVGHPIDLSTSAQFDKASITFTLTDRAGAVDLKNLRIMWWDPKKQRMTELPNQQINEANISVTAETTHFSQYVLVDKAKWDAVWKEGYEPGKPTVLRGRISQVAVAATYAYDGGSLMTTGVVNRTDLESNLRLGMVNSQSFEHRSSNDNLVSQAVNSLAADVTNEDKWKVLLIASDTRNIEDPDAQEAINQAIAHQIKIFSFWTSDHQGTGSTDICQVAHQTDGACFQDDLMALETSQEIWTEIWNSIKKEEDIDSDGIPDQVERDGILIATGERVFPSTSTADTDRNGIPDGQDTDSDGLIDGYELGYTDWDGNAYTQAEQHQVEMPVTTTGLAKANETNGGVYQLIPVPVDGGNSGGGGNPEVIPTAATYKSLVDQPDSDDDGYQDKQDVVPMEYYKRPIFFLHGVFSNDWNVYGAPTAIATADHDNNDFWTWYADQYVPSNEKMFTEDYYLQYENQKVIGNQVDPAALYKYLQGTVDSKGRALYVHGENMFAFNYQNWRTFYTNAELFDRYLSKLIDEGRLNGPVRGDETQTRIDVVVHSMGGLVARYYNERMNTYYRKHSIHINKLVSLATPHRGGRFANFANIPILAGNALKSLAETDMKAQEMNSGLMTTDSFKNGATYHALGAVRFPDDSKWVMPTALQQDGSSTTSYEYSPSVGNYEKYAHQLILDAMEEDGIKACPCFGGYCTCAPDSSDGNVRLNSAFGYFPPYEPWYQLQDTPRSLPFDEYWGYIGPYKYNHHTTMHHNRKVMDRVSKILKAGT